jgi:F-box domain
MDYLRRLLCRSRERQRPAALSASILNKVPVEILVYILDYLPPESAVAFSLSCMHLKYLLGTQHFLRVASTEDTLALLNLLALDLPNHVVCSTCKRLHNMENLRRYNSTTCSAGSTTYQYDSLRFPACVSQDRNNNTYTVTNLFGATAFKMAIKRYHQQPECTELLKIMSSKVAETMETKSYVQQFREECRVVQGCLMHRRQSVYISRKCLTTMPFRLGPPSERICPHIKFGISEHNIGSGVRRCQECRTEYCINFKYYDGHGLAMFFTRWKDLGPGPESEVWTQHLLPESEVQRSRLASLRALFDPSVRAQTSVGPQTQVEVRPQAGDLSSAFGDSDDFKFDSLLTSRNEAELFRFQKQMLAKAN